MKIGVVSDTHNYLDARVLEIFRGVDHILHGGDIGRRDVLAELAAVAPVTAVAGNTDEDPGYPPIAVVTLGHRKFLLHHIVTPGTFTQPIHRRIAIESPDVVVFGHTHQQFVKRFEKTLFLNPGYAGKPRFAMPRSVALLHCDDGEIRHEFVDLQ